MELNKIRVGTKVHYLPSHFSKDMGQNGIVKEIPKFAKDPNSFIGYQHVRVVFHCGEDWKNYKKYTSALTPVKDLFKGWR